MSACITRRRWVLLDTAVLQSLTLYRFRPQEYEHYNMHTAKQKPHIPEMMHRKQER